MSKIFRSSSPFYVQFELTGECGHKCFFCYNKRSKTARSELSTKQIQNLLEQMRDCGVFSINFNGGEPLMRPDFFLIAQYAAKLGFDIHLNTNATLIGDTEADLIAELFPSICTSVLSADQLTHDKLVGAKGAFHKMRQAVSRLLARNVKIEVNVCTFKENYKELYAIARTMAQTGVHVFCVTRFIPATREHIRHTLGKAETTEILDILSRIKNDFPTYAEVKLPGPVPFCELDRDAKDRLANWGIPCQIGYGLCRISPQGDMTPCPLSPYVIGNLCDEDFRTLWRSPKWDRFAQLGHLPMTCHTCEELHACRGGCICYDEAFLRNWIRPDTAKWNV